ncbi:MAG: DUF6263 family protein [Planctomycetota bacterium]|nr:DUF6263 family protein [Planctomycetota bacterium]
MRPLKLFFYLLCLSLNCSLCLAQENPKAAVATRVRLNWRVGAVQNYRQISVVKVTGGTEGKDPSLDVEARETSYWTQKVVSVDAKGVATLKVQFTRFVLNKGEKGAALNQVMDTDSFDKTKNPLSEHFVLRALLKIPFTVKINRLGRVSEVKGINLGFNKYLKATKEMSLEDGEEFKQIWSNRFLRLTWNGYFQRFSDKALTPKQRFGIGPVLALNGLAYLNEERELTLKSVQARNKGKFAVIVGVGRPSKKKVDKALNTRGKEVHSTKLEKSHSRTVVELNSGTIQQVHLTRKYSTKLKAPETIEYVLSADETTTIQLLARAKVKKAK